MNTNPFNITNAVTDNIYEDIKLPLNQRKGYTRDSEKITLPVYFYQIIGIDNEEDYFNRLFTFDQKLSKHISNYIRITEELTSTYNNYNKTKFDKAWDKVSFYNRRKANFIMSLLKPENIFPHHNDKSLQKLFENAFESIIDLIITKKSETSLKELQPLIFKILCYCHNYIHKLFPAFDYVKNNPKVIYYGNITSDEIYFLILLQQLSCDIVYFNSLDECDFKLIDSDHIFTQSVKLDKRIRLKPFPASELQIRTNTVAVEASKEINDMLFSNEGGFYKPWQFTDYMVKNIPLSTTYEELYILGIQQAMFRPDFIIDNFTINIPCMFTKVSGVHKEIKKYWKEVHSLVQQPNVLVFDSLPLVKAFDEISNKEISYEAIHYQKILKPNKINIDPEKLMESELWKYSHLHMGLQIVLANKISDICFELWAFKEKIQTLENRIKTLSMLLKIDRNIITLLQKFDYPFHIPKIILYTKNSTLKIEETILLTFLNSLGMDIIIYSPSGYNDIENFLDKGSYNIHRLEELNMEINYKPYKPKFYSKWFK